MAHTNNAPDLVRASRRNARTPLTPGSPPQKPKRVRGARDSNLRAQVAQPDQPMDDRPELGGNKVKPRRRA